MGSLEFEPDDDGWGRDGGGVSDWSFVTIEDCEELVVKIADEGGEDDDDATADSELDAFDDWFDLFRFRGWY